MPNPNPNPNPNCCGDMGLTDLHHQDQILNPNPNPNPNPSHSPNPNPNPSPRPSLSPNPSPNPNPNPNPYCVPNHRSLFRNPSPLNSSPVSSSPSSNSSYCSTSSEMKAAASMAMMMRRRSSSTTTATTPERRYDSINTKITRLNHILRNLDESKGAIVPSPSAAANQSLQLAPANLSSNGTTNLRADTRPVQLGPADYDRQVSPSNPNLATICTRDNPNNHHSDRSGSANHSGYTDSSHPADRAATPPAFAFVADNRGRQMWPCSYDLHPNPAEAVASNRFQSALDHYHRARYPTLISANQGPGLASTRLIAPDYGPAYEPNYRDCMRLAMNPESARSMNYGVVAGMAGDPVSRNAAAMMGSSCLGTLDSGRNVAAMMGSCGMIDSDLAARGAAAARRRAKGPSDRMYGRINKDDNHLNEEEDYEENDEEEYNDGDGDGSNGDDSFVKVAKMANEILTRVKRLEAQQTNHHKKKLSITTTTATNKGKTSKCL